MIEAWRVVKTEYADDAFSGEGAALYAGRWHSAGTRIVYTAESIALATLEILVRLRKTQIPDYVLIPCHFGEELVQDFDITQLPENWSDPVAPIGLRQFGDRWARQHTSPVLKVPSAVTLVEFNYLLNPDHRDFEFIHIGEPQPFKLDYRLIT